jgi:hypothetical protein
VEEIMEKQNESVRDRLLARLPQPENLAAYRDETESLLAKHEKALFWEKWTNRMLSFLAIAIFLTANLFLKPDITRMITFDVTAGILFFLATVNGLQEFIYRNQVNLLKEIKQLQLQVLELQASLLKTGGQSL